jgi:hypothetical protein
VIFSSGDNFIYVEIVKKEWGATKQGDTPMMGRQTTANYGETKMFRETIGAREIPSHHEV